MIWICLTAVVAVICFTSYGHRELLHRERMTELEFNHEARMYELGAVEEFVEVEEDDAEVVELEEVAMDLADDEAMYMDDELSDDEDGPDLAEGDDYKE